MQMTQLYKTKYIRTHYKHQQLYKIIYSGTFWAIRQWTSLYIQQSARLGMKKPRVSWHEHIFIRNICILLHDMLLAISKQNITSKQDGIGAHYDTERTSNTSEHCISRSKGVIRLSWNMTHHIRFYWNLLLNQICCVFSSLLEIFQLMTWKTACTEKNGYPKQYLILQGL